MSGLGSFLNVRFGLAAFSAAHLWAGWSGSGPIGPGAVQAVHRRRREMDLRDCFSLGLSGFVEASVLVIARDFARAVEQGDGAVPIFEHPDFAFGEVMPVAALR